MHAVAGHDAALYLEQAEVGLGGADADVAGHGRLHAAADGEAVHRGDHRLRDVDPGEAGVDRAVAEGRFAPSGGVAFGHLLEVRAGGEGAAGAGDDGGAHVRVGDEVLDRLAQLLA